MGALCYRDCKTHNMENCGIGACSATASGCASSILGMIAKVVEGVASAILLVVSFGSSSEVVVAESAVKKGVVQIGKDALKLAFNGVKSALTGVFKKGIVATAKDMVQKKGGSVIMGLSTEFVGEFCDKIYEKVTDTKIQQDPTNDVQKLANAVDIFNIQGTIKDCKGGQTPAACAEDIVDTLSTFDPTGLLTIASAFIKPKCDV